MSRPGEDLLGDPVAWGRQLIMTHDHDPLYSGLVNARYTGTMDTDRVRRFLLAYWCCYSVGASWWLSQHQGVEFWVRLREAAANVTVPPPLGAGVSGMIQPTSPRPDQRWPRAHERRHWRGDKCVQSVHWLAHRFSRPEVAINSLEHLCTLKDVEAAVTQWPQFGPWIAFKAADMLERVLDVPVAFPPLLTTMYKDPKEGAEMAAPLMGLSSPQEVTDVMLEAYQAILAPPVGGRHVNVQEVETVLCKWKSARRGHYWIGCDTQSHRAELEAWGAHDFLAVYPKVPGLTDPAPRG